MNALENKKTQPKTKPIPEPILKRINCDFVKLKTKYPFSKEIKVAELNVICYEVFAISKKEIDKYSLKQSDLEKTKYSKKCILTVSKNYLEVGAVVYGLFNWNGLDKIPMGRVHFYKYKKKNGMYELCTCVPQAIKTMKNPLLAQVRTADKTMCAYELFLNGTTDEIILRDYPHGEEGLIEYEYEQKRKNKRL